MAMSRLEHVFVKPALAHPAVPDQRLESARRQGGRLTVNRQR
jgi:hypothetical protein